jgi:hypothetical protein
MSGVVLFRTRVSELAIVVALAADSQTTLGCGWPARLRVVFVFFSFLLLRTLHRAAPRWPADFPELASACQSGTAWAGLRLTPPLNSLILFFCWRLY